MHRVGCRPSKEQLDKLIVELILRPRPARLISDHY